jgi:hypothetical protein
MHSDMALLGLSSPTHPAVVSFVKLHVERDTPHTVVPNGSAASMFESMVGVTELLLLC